MLVTRNPLEADREKVDVVRRLRAKLKGQKSNSRSLKKRCAGGELRGMKLPLPTSPMSRQPLLKLSLTMWTAAIAKVLGIGRASVYRALNRSCRAVIGTALLSCSMTPKVCSAATSTPSFVCKSAIWDAMIIRIARLEDAAAIWSIIGPVIRAGATYTLDQNMSEEQAITYWLGPDKETFVAEDEGIVLGTYYIRPNQAGGGKHICNCGYMTAALSTGRGVARRMCEHSLSHARLRGYRGMQFNFVVSTNERAVRLWQSLGFGIVGRLPLAFHHPFLGYVDALVMFQPLTEPA